MSDDLTARLQAYYTSAETCAEAADRINALTAERDRLREALSRIAYPANLHGSAMAAARAALADPEPLTDDICRKCGHRLGRWRFGSKETGFEHMEGECVPEPECPRCEGSGVVPANWSFGPYAVDPCPDCTEKET